MTYAEDLHVPQRHVQYAHYNFFLRHPIKLDQPLFARTIGPFSKSYFIAKIYELLLQAGIPTQGFSGHSIRKSDAVSVSARGISTDDINETTISEYNNKLLLLNKQLQPLASSIILGTDFLFISGIKSIARKVETCRDARAACFRA